MFEEQEQRINDLYEDVDVVVSKLNDNLVPRDGNNFLFAAFWSCCIFPAVNKCNRGDEKVSEEVKKEAEATVTGTSCMKVGRPR